jgi:hypothetical protein
MYDWRRRQGFYCDTVTVSEQIFLHIKIKLCLPRQHNWHPQENHTMVGRPDLQDCCFNPLTVSKHIMLHVK